MTKENTPDPRRADNRRTVLFMIMFGVLNLLFFYLSVYRPFVEGAILPFTGFIAIVCSGVLNLLGLDTHAVGEQLRGTGLSLSLRNGCNGVLAMSIFFSAVLAFPSGMSHKLRGLVAGFLLIFVLNALRVVSLYLLALRWPKIFEAAHVYVWQTIIILAVVAFWMRWAGQQEQVS